jgi:hypothetical protein
MSRPGVHHGLLAEYRLHGLALGAVSRTATRTITGIIIGTAATQDVHDHDHS